MTAGQLLRGKHVEGPGFACQRQPPDASAVQSGWSCKVRTASRSPSAYPRLKTLLAQQSCYGPGRDGVIVPIARNYARDLLGYRRSVSPLLWQPEAAFVARRTYFNSPRTPLLMRPGVPILFYESRRSGGRGAVVATARISDATVVAKLHVPDDLLRRAVVEDLGPLSATSDLLATSFDNLLRFPAPVSLENASPTWS